jgi:hypothetical protein
MALSSQGTETLQTHEVTGGGAAGTKEKCWFLFAIISDGGVYHGAACSHNYIAPLQYFIGFFISFNLYSG